MTDPQHVATSGWLLAGQHAWWFLVLWTAAVWGYGLWRSMGDAPQDPHRPSGPVGL